MAALSDFMPRVLPYVVGCSFPLAEQFIRDTCIDFCTQAPIVQVRLDPVSLLAGQNEYEFDTPSGMAVIYILRAEYRGMELTISKESFPFAPVVGQPNALCQTGSQSFIINSYPTSDEPDAISVLTSLKPTQKSQIVPDILMEDYADAIANGAIAKLMCIPNQAFSNPALSLSFQKNYEKARINARIRAEASFGMTHSRAKFRSFI